MGTLYGVYNPEGRFIGRANIAIDKSGIIRQIERGSSAIEPSSVLRACRMKERR